jgi:hypothetical protein
LHLARATRSGNARHCARKIYRFSRGHWIECNSINHDAYTRTFNHYVYTKQRIGQRTRANFPVDPFAYNLGNWHASRRR